MKALSNKVLWGIVGLVLLVAGFFLFGYISKYAHKNTPFSSGGGLRVVTSFYPLYFFASQISGDKAQVINIVPAGFEPHEYEPTAQDIVSIQHSKLLLVIGDGFEPWLSSVQKNNKMQQTDILELGKNIINKRDPHVWLSPMLAMNIVENIKQVYIKQDPANASYYEHNAEELKTKLIDLDALYKRGLAHCTQKNIITSHAAFGYLASRYGLTQIPIALSPDAEPSPQQLVDIISFAKSHKVSYIFFESLVSPKLSQVIATEIGAKTLVLDPIEGLTKERQSAGDNYFTLMNNNLINLKTALNCE